jgi:uncharacterized protein
MKSVKLILWTFVGALLVTGAVFFFNTLRAPTLTINNETIKVELANTLETRIQGLSGRDELAQDSGMLFIFDEPGFHSFWMKDMLFALDIIWIDDQLTVVDMHKNITPETFPEAFRPTKPAQLVLEVNTGFIENYNIQQGDQVVLNGF